MTTSITNISIELEVKNTKIKLSIEEAKALRDTLMEIFHEPKTYFYPQSPYPYIFWDNYKLYDPIWDVYQIGSTLTVSNNA